jgi:hypothetical protein
MKYLDFFRDILLEKQDPCWDGYKQLGTKQKNGKTVPNCVKIESAEINLENTSDILEMLYFIRENNMIDEATYQGRSVKLNKPMRGDVKKFKVFVKDPSTGNIKKVNFGDPNMRIKKSNPKRRKSFRARHHCENPGPKTKARYWSCKKW